jgi:hypothetical protein
MNEEGKIIELWENPKKIKYNMFAKLAVLCLIGG